MKGLVISSLFDAADAEGSVVTLGALAQLASQLASASSEVGDIRNGPVTDPEVIARIESARETLLAITQRSQQLSRLLSRAVLRAELR